MRASGLTGDYWLGASDIDHEGLFRWKESQLPLSYSNFPSGEPNNANGNQDCLVVGFKDSSNEWYDRDCDEGYGIVCQFSAF